MKVEAFVIGDIHGKNTMLSKILKHWQKDKQQLVFLGDIVDRGDDIKGAVDQVRQLQNQGAWVLRGNHEAMLLEFLRDPDLYWPRYKRNGGMSTIQALTGHPLEQLEEMTASQLSAFTKQRCPWLVEWIESLPLYIEYGQWIFVHAGIDLEIEDWRQTESSRFYWIREEFHQAANNTGKKIIFGHTPVAYLHGTSSIKSTWTQQNKWGIDGGAVYGGTLIALHIRQDGKIIEEFQIDYC